MAQIVTPLGPISFDAGTQRMKLAASSGSRLDPCTAYQRAVKLGTMPAKTVAALRAQCVARATGGSVAAGVAAQQPLAAPSAPVVAGPLSSDGGGLPVPAIVAGLVALGAVAFVVLKR